MSGPYDPPDLPYPLTPEGLTPTMRAAMPEAMQSAFITVYNAFRAIEIEDDYAFNMAMEAMYWARWTRGPDGSYSRLTTEVEKAGRVFSAKNLSVMRECRDSMTKACGMLGGLIGPEAEMEDETEDEAVEKSLNTITKVEERRMAYGWANVTKIGKKDVVDSQGDVIDINNLRDAMHEYMAGERVVDTNHDYVRVGQTVELIVIDDDVAKALTADLKKGLRGAFYARKYDDTPAGQAALAAIKDGTNAMSSICGSGSRSRSPIGKRNPLP